MTNAGVLSATGCAAPDARHRLKLAPNLRTTAGYQAPPERLAALDKLIAYMRSKPGVWFATHEGIARYLKSAVK